MSKNVSHFFMGLLVATLLGMAGCGNFYGSTSSLAGTTAKAGLAQNVFVGSLVTLDGSQSYGVNGSSITYEWTIIAKPAGSNATINNPTAVKPTFRADVPGQYSFKLLVTDDKSNTSEDTLTVIAAAGNAAPVANAGTDQVEVTGTLVTLDGSLSNAANGSQLSYNWNIASKPDGSTVTLAKQNVAKPSFTPDVGGNYVFSLVVNDGISDSDPATVTILVDTLNSIFVQPSNATIAIGQTKQFFANGSFAKLGVKTITDSVNWVSSDTSVATINGKGLATATGPGTTTISALMAGKTSSTPLNVGSAVLLNIKVDNGPLIPAISDGQSLQLTATATYTDATRQDVTELASWSVKTAALGTNCITISNTAGTKGLVKTTGQACYNSVTASYNGMQVAVYVTVNAPGK
jgi:hypothetical protein